MPAFDYPWLLLGLPLALLPMLFSRPDAALAYTLQEMPAVAPTLRQRLIWLPGCLRVLGLALLVFAAAGPHWGAVRMTDETRGIAIELVLDRSGSMSLADLDYKTRRVTRLAAVKTIAKEFLLGNGDDLKGRSGDAIGLVSFAAHPQSLSPLVSHNESALSRNIDSIEIAHGMDDATAIGDAVALAASRIRVTEEARAIAFRSKIVILLTDGQENAGTLKSGDAARMAARWNIRIYAVGIRPMPEGATRENEIGYGLDALSSTTGGMAVMAGDSAGLRRFFAAIDRLEPNAIPATDLNGGLNASTLVLATALLFVSSEIVLRNTWMRTAP